MARPTIKDVANRAGVSTATVSYVLNNTGSVSQQTASRVRQCVKDLGYRANSLAIAHRTGRSGTIGLAIPDLTNPFFPEFAQGVHASAYAAGFAVQILDANNSRDFERSEIEHLSDRVPEGLIWVPVGDTNITDTPQPFPVVVYDRDLPGYDSLAPNLFEGGRLQASLILQHGHSRVGILSGPEASDTAHLRLAGLLEGLEGNAEIVWHHSIPFTANIPDEIADAITTCRAVTAVATANDIQAIGLLRQFRAAGRSVPDDVSVVGFDGTALSDLVSPSLTTISLHPRRLGEQAFAMLQDRIRHADNPPRRIVGSVDTKLGESLSYAPS